MTDEATNPVGSDDNPVDEGTVQPEAEVETESETEIEPELDDDGNPVEGPDEPDEEEIELDDFKLKLPKDQAQKAREALLRQADYTRKTQELAEQRKAFQSERETVQRATNAEIGALAKAQGFEQEIARYADIDWDAWYQQDYQAAQIAESKLNRLKSGRADAIQELTQMRQQRTIAEQQETARLIDEGRKVLARDIQGWNDNLARDLITTGVKEYGFDQSEIEEFTDPRMVKVLHDAHQWRKSQGKQKTVDKQIAAQQVKPASRIGAKSAPPSGLDDRLSADEWVRRRNEQLRKRG